MAIDLSGYLQYVYAFAIIIVALIIGQIILWFTNVYVRKLTSKTKTDLDDIILDKIRMPIYYISIFIGIFIGIRTLSIPDTYSTIISNSLYSIMILIIAFAFVQIVGVFITFWVRKRIEKSKSSLDDELFPIFTKTVNAVVYILALLYILRVWSVEITPLLAGLGIAGLAVGLALKPTLENIFGGVSIIGDRYFKVGDTIKLESGEVGNVTDIGLRSTKIQTFDSEVIIIPNAQIASGRLINYAKPRKVARISMDVGVEYGSDPDKVKKVILETIQKLAKNEKHIEVRDPEPAVFFTNMGDFALTFAVKVWVDDYKERYGVKDKLNTEIYNALKKAKIGIPFPTHTVYLQK